MTTEDRLEKVGRVTVPVKALALLAFLGTLLLEWQRVSVEVAGAVHVEKTTIGWNGWGFVAGVLALLLLVLMFGEVPAGDRQRPATSSPPACCRWRL